MSDLQRWSRENFARLSDEQRALCISHLSDSLVPWPDVVTRWKEQAAAGVPLGSDDVSFHNIAGAALRNILRQVLKDDKLPMVSQPGGMLASNWDDYYIGALHAFITEEINGTQVVAA